jgi:hypothetical protein
MPCGRLLSTAGSASSSWPPTTTRGAVLIDVAGMDGYGVGSAIQAAVRNAYREAMPIDRLAVVGSEVTIGPFLRVYGRHIPSVMMPAEAFGARVHFDERLPPDRLWLVPASRVFPAEIRVEYAPSAMRDAYRDLVSDHTDFVAESHAAATQRFLDLAELDGEATRQLLDLAEAAAPPPEGQP